MSSTCGGECCAVFWVPKDRDWTKVTDGAYIQDMLIPLTRRQSLRRWRKFVSKERPLPEWGDDQTAATCKHWDEESRLCGAYEDRPDMCRDYPYGNACSHGCGYQVDSAVWQKYGNGNWSWDEDAKGWRPRTNAEFLWDAENGVLKPIPKETPA